MIRSFKILRLFQHDTDERNTLNTSVELNPNAAVSLNFRSNYMWLAVLKVAAKYIFIFKKK